MKTILTLFAAFAVAMSVNAQSLEQYGATTLYSFAGTDTNIVGQATNIAATVTLTKWDQFFLEFRATGTNSAGTATTGWALAWQHSADGTNWGTVDGISRGWFAFPSTNQITTIATTNIVVNSAGYWRLNWVTNNTGHHVTNMSIRAWTKPIRQGRYP